MAASRKQERGISRAEPPRPKHSGAEAADIQYVAVIWDVTRRVRLDANRDQLWAQLVPGMCRSDPDFQSGRAKSRPIMRR